MKKKTYLTWFSPNKSNPIFFNNWEECKQYVTGLSGIQYKSFPSQQAAENFLHQDIPELSNLNTTIKNSNNSLLAVYVDGSYHRGCPFAGWAWVVIKNNEVIEQDYGITSQIAKSNNVDGEIQATLSACQWIEKYFNSLNQSSKSENCKKMTLFYDYEGIASWALGKWKTKIPLTIEYKEKIKFFLKYIEFKKVTAHSGDKWNDLVDKLAKKAIAEYLEQTNI